MRAFVLLLFAAFSVSAQELPPAVSGYSWRDFPGECMEFQVPDGWTWHETTIGPAHVLMVSPHFTAEGKYDTGFTLNTVVCRNPKEWKDAYLSALKLWSDKCKEVEALGKPTIETAKQSDGMQVFVVEGGVFLPGAPHPDRKYKVQLVVRAFPNKGVVYVYTFGALDEDWDRQWSFGQTIFNPFVFRFPKSNG
jgi:hypothetical protein